MLFFHLITLMAIECEPKFQLGMESAAAPPLAQGINRNVHRFCVGLGNFWKRDLKAVLFSLFSILLHRINCRMAVFLLLDKYPVHIPKDIKIYTYCYDYDVYHMQTMFWN